MLYSQHHSTLFDKSMAAQYVKQLMMEIFGISVYGYQGRDKKELNFSVQQLLPWMYQIH